MVAAALSLGSVASANWCSAEYMHDSCSLDAYDIVQVEKRAHVRHNYIHGVHHLGVEKKRAKKCRTTHRIKYPTRKKHSKRLYRYTKCGLVQRKR